MKFRLSSLKLQNNKGLTLIELLAIVVILGILIAASVSYMNNSFDKSRQADVQHVFENFRDNATVTLQNTAGKSDLAELNNSLDPALAVDATTNLTKTKKDPWGNAYTVKVASVTAGTTTVPAQTQIIVSSNGKDGLAATADDFYQVVYYVAGNTDQATKGFGKNDMALGVFKLGADSATCVVGVATGSESCTAPAAGTAGTVGKALVMK